MEGIAVINDLRQEIQALRSQNDALAARLDRLERGGMSAQVTRLQFASSRRFAVGLANAIEAMIAPWRERPEPSADEAAQAVNVIGRELGITVVVR